MSKTYEIIRNNPVAAIGEQFVAADFGVKGKLKALGTLDALLQSGMVRALTPSRKAVAEPIAEAPPAIDAKP